MTVMCPAFFFLRCPSESCHVISKSFPKFGISENGVTAMLPPELDDEGAAETESLP